MLSLLHIENIAVIESADISFDGGFTVLTGETGAGKSIVIDAISAILGERAYRDMIRTGANKATVRAVFTGVPKLQWFEDNGVEYDPETIVQREIFLDGKNVCRVNGSLVTVSILRKLASSSSTSMASMIPRPCLTRTTILLFWTHLPGMRRCGAITAKNTRRWRSCGGKSTA